MFPEKISGAEGAKLDEARRRARIIFDDLMDRSSVTDRLTTETVAEVAALGAANGEGIRSRREVDQIAQELLASGRLKLSYKKLVLGRVRQKKGSR